MQLYLTWVGFSGGWGLFEIHITKLNSRPHSEKAADEIAVSGDDFQFLSAKYEIIVLPILPANLYRQKHYNWIYKPLFVEQGMKLSPPCIA